MPTTTMLHVRMDEDTKDRATAALAAMGLSVSEAVRVFLHKVAAEQALPFAISVPNSATQAAMQEARSMSQGRFHDAKSLFDDLDAKSS